MVKDGKRKYLKPKIWLLCEGATEEMFYKRIVDEILVDLDVNIDDVRGVGNIGKAVLAHTEPPYTKGREPVQIYCCVDSKKEYGSVPDFDLEDVRRACIREKKRNVLLVDAIVANQMIESLFFYDLDGIYSFLEVKARDRKPAKKYSNPTRCRKSDIKKLFKKHGQYYHSGVRAKPLINKLDIHKIQSKCPELRDGIEKIKSNAEDLTNHLFGTGSKERRL